MNRILFLDIDGVILAGRHWKEKPHRLDMPADTITLLNEICERSGAIVVVSSTWRRDDRLRRKLHRNGFTGRFHRDWRTPYGEDIPLPWTHHLDFIQRGDEIADWLRRHPPDRFCIIDDDSDMLDEQKPFFIKTEFEQGMTREHVERVIVILTAMCE
jgi:hypothetical protein